MEANYCKHATLGMMRRWACMLYEGLLAFGVVFVTAMMFGLLTQTRNAMDNRLGLQIIVFVALGIYFVWFWSKGQTLAMKTWHLYLTLPDGRPVPQARALLRYVLSWMTVLPPLLLAYSLHYSPQVLIITTAVWLFTWTGIAQLRSDRQLLHDVWAGTTLSYAPPTPSKSHRTYSD